jgi:hypothetical protein
MYIPHDVFISSLFVLISSLCSQQAAKYICWLESNPWQAKLVAYVLFFISPYIDIAMHCREVVCSPTHRTHIVDGGLLYVLTICVLQIVLTRCFDSVMYRRATHNETKQLFHSVMCQLCTQTIR